MEPEIDSFGILWRIGATMVFVVLNGFFVAAEFAFVRVRAARIIQLADDGSRGARVAEQVLERLDHYLSACQLGITMSSLALGWLGEPAVVTTLVVAAGAVGIELGDSVLLHGVAFALAFFLITMLHMTLGEQAPKIWALQRPELGAVRSSLILWTFSKIFTPVIWLVNMTSNWMVRMTGLPAINLEEGSHTAGELLSLVGASAQAGHITPRQQEFAERVLHMRDLEVRHILVPRQDVVHLSLQDPLETSLQRIEETKHSRFPLCEVGLDSVVGVLHIKDLIPRLRAGDVDLRAIALDPIFVPEAQRISLLIRDLQAQRRHVAVVLDERGTCTGLAFLEDAVEQVVGPIYDEFDQDEPEVVTLKSGGYEMSGSLPLPRAFTQLGLEPEHLEEDTIGGHVIATLERLPQTDEQLTIGKYLVTVTRMSSRRVERLRFEPLPSSKGEALEAEG